MVVHNVIHRSVEDWMMMWNRHVGWRALIGCWIVFGVGCGGAPPVENVAVVSVPVVEDVARVEPDRFVLVLPTTRLFRAPSESADFVQLRSVEEDAAGRAAFEQLVGDRRERDVKADRAWNDRE